MFQSNLTRKYGFSKGLEMDDHHDLIANAKRDHESVKDDLFYFDMGFPPFRSCEEEEIKKLADADSAALEVLKNEAKRERPYSASLHILKNYRKRFRKLNKTAIHKDCSFIASEKLSTVAILRLAAESFIQFSSQGDTESSAVSHPYAFSFSGLSHEDVRSIQLVQYLLASAEKVGSKQFERASKLLLECDKGSSNHGNPIERLVFYYSGALQERIDRETGTVSPRGLGSKQCRDILETMRGPKPEMIAMQKNVPFSQVTQLAGIQAILDHVADSTRIHFIDLEIRTGMHCTLLMQALTSRSVNFVEYLKITAVGNKSKAKQLEETRDRLLSFAQTLNMNLFFNIVVVDKITDLKETLFEVRPDEAVAVWIEFYLLFFIRRQDILESLMTVVRGFNPRITILTEEEGNNNSPVFVTRFIESLFHYGGFFECLADCLKDDPRNRNIVEYVYFSQAIRNIVATEGEEREIRHVTVQVWRSFFARFGLVQAELSMSAIYQANLALKNFACGKSCTLDMDGKCLIVGWKGSPVHSLSAWKVRS